MSKRTELSSNEYQKYLAQKKGYASRGEQQNALAIQRGFRSYYDYQNNLAQEKGFASSYDYQNNLAQQKGFASLHKKREYSLQERGYATLGAYQRERNQQKQLNPKNQEFSTVIKNRLKELGQKQAWLCREIGISESALSLYLSGKRTPLSEIKLKIYETLGITPLTLEDLVSDFS